MKSGQTIYVAGGAVVYGAVLGKILGEKITNKEAGNISIYPYVSDIKINGVTQA